MAPNGEELQQLLEKGREKRVEAIERDVESLKILLHGDGTSNHPGIAHTVVEMSKDMYVGPNCLMENTRELREFKIKLCGYAAGVIVVIVTLSKIVSHFLK